MVSLGGSNGKVNEDQGMVFILERITVIAVYHCI
jgi:hypothetical protein